MTTMLAVLELKDYALTAGLIALLGGGVRYMSSRGIRQLRSMQKTLDAMQKKLDALLKHQGVAWPPPPRPSGLSEEVEQLASNPATKIAAIKAYREENPGVGLVEAKAKIEAFYNSKP